MEINKLAQNDMLPFMIELSSILRQDDENAIDLDNKTALAARIYNFDVSQIDTVHRVSDSIRYSRNSCNRVI